MNRCENEVGLGMFDYHTAVKFWGHIIIVLADKDIKTCCPIANEWISKIWVKLYCRK